MFHVKHFDGHGRSRLVNALDSLYVGAEFQGYRDEAL